jgi:hypothetical protein
MSLDCMGDGVGGETRWDGVEDDQCEKAVTRVRWWETAREEASGRVLTMPSQRYEYNGEFCNVASDWIRDGQDDQKECRRMLCNEG